MLLFLIFSSHDWNSISGKYFMTLVCQMETSRKNELSALYIDVKLEKLQTR